MRLCALMVQSKNFGVIVVLGTIRYRYLLANRNENYLYFSIFAFSNIGALSFGKKCYRYLIIQNVFISLSP